MTARVTGYRVVRTDSGAYRWRVYADLDAWPHEEHVRAKSTKREAEALARMLRAGACNAADAAIVVRGEMASLARRVPARDLEGGRGMQHVLERFALLFRGFPFPDYAAFIADVCPDLAQSAPTPTRSG